MDEEGESIPDGRTVYDERQVKLWHIQWMIRSLLSPYHRGKGRKLGERGRF